MTARLDVGLLVLMAMLFSVFPQIDLWVSGLFFDAANGFWLRQDVWVQAVYHGTGTLARLSGVLLLIATVAGLLRRSGLLYRHRRCTAFLLCALLLGPGLVVNNLFKDQWGRARPLQTRNFGGVQAFTPALLPSTACNYNCSFVSGHAAIGFVLMAPAFFGPRRRYRWLAAGIVAGLAIGAVRIVQGGHYLSDVLFCGSVIWFFLCAQARAFRLLGGGPLAAVSASPSPILLPQPATAVR